MARSGRVVMMKIQKYGWIPDLPNRPGEDGGDLVFAPKAMRLDPAANLAVGYIPPPYNQGNIGSCTGSSTAPGSVSYLIAKEGQPRNPMSALFAYFNARWLEGTQ